MAKRSIRTVGCFIEREGRFLILHRRPGTADGGRWGLPAGKIEEGETDEEAILREIAEETGHKAAREELEFLGDFRFDFPDLHVEFPTYRLVLERPIEVKHNPAEHTEWRWVTSEECDAMPDLIRGFHDLLRRTGYRRP